MVGLDDLLALRNIDRVKVKQLFDPNLKSKHLKGQLDPPLVT